MSVSSSEHLPELMAILAHDLRNPLAALLTNIHFVQSVTRGTTPDIDEALSDSAMSCAILGQIIGNLEVIGRAFASGQPSPTPVAMRDAVNQAVARAAAQATLAGIAVVVVPGSSGATVLSDPLFLGRTLDNVLANALQYAPAKSTITIAFVSKDGRGGVFVTDRGPVVPPEFRARVFTEEGQAAAKKRYEARYGRGLGLYCAAQAARLANVEIALGERDGQSLVELWAPLSAP